MTDKERLETIKFRLTFGSMNLCNAPRLSDFESPFEIVQKEDLAWLIQQAERVRELENILEQDHRQAVLEGLYEDNEWLKKRIVKLNEFTEKMNVSGCELKSQNKRLREALKFYGNQFNYENHAENIRKDFGETARKTLEGEEK